MNLKGFKIHFDNNNLINPVKGIISWLKNSINGE
jgi:hypothetical protein